MCVVCVYDAMTRFVLLLQPPPIREKIQNHKTHAHPDNLAPPHIFLYLIIADQILGV